MSIDDLHGVTSTMIIIKRTLCAVSMIFALGVSNHAGATFSFSDVTIPSGSVPFAIDGDMTGYSASSGLQFDNEQFSVRSEGDIWNGVLTDSPIVWSASVFDGATITDPGNTVTFRTDTRYTWSHHSFSLTSETAPHSFEPVLLGSAAVGPIAKPETHVMLLAGLGLMGFVMLRRNVASASK